jgi:hypothetical protein
MQGGSLNIMLSSMSGQSGLWVFGCYRGFPQPSRQHPAVLHEFGFASTGLTAADFQEPDCAVQLGHAPNRVDILTSLTGLDFEHAWREREPGKLDDVPVYFLSKACFIKNKQATARPQDIADIARLMGTTQTKP